MKYFSGTATYHRKFEVAVKTMLAPDRVFCLDLGRVAVIAQVKLNGHDLGILWKPPFCVDVTEILQAGTNDLEVSVVNLWPNRLIGDDQLPERCGVGAADRIRRRGRCRRSGSISGRVSAMAAG